MFNLHSFQLIKSVLSSSDPTVLDIFSAVLSQQAMGSKVDSAAVNTILASALKKKEDDLANLGYAFQIAAVTGNKDMHAKINDALVQVRKSHYTYFISPKTVHRTTCLYSKLQNVNCNLLL